MYQREALTPLTGGCLGKRVRSDVEMPGYKLKLSGHIPEFPHFKCGSDAYTALLDTKMSRVPQCPQRTPRELFPGGSPAIWGSGDSDLPPGLGRA